MQLLPRFDSGNEPLVDETGYRMVPDNLSESFFTAYSASDSERMGTMANLSGVGARVRRMQRRRLSGLQPPPWSLYSSFIRNSATRGPGKVSGGGLAGLGFSASEVLADPSGFGYVQMDDGSWFNSDTGSSITTDGQVIDPTSQIPGAITTGVASVIPNNQSVNSSTGPGSISGYLDQFVKAFPDIMKGITTVQLSQINLQRMQQGLSPLTTGQVLGVAGAPPAISPLMILGVIGVGIFALSGRRR